MTPPCTKSDVHGRRAADLRLGARIAAWGVFASVVGTSCATPATQLEAPAPSAPAHPREALDTTIPQRAHGLAVAAPAFVPWSARVVEPPGNPRNELVAPSAEGALVEATLHGEPSVPRARLEACIQAASPDLVSSMITSGPDVSLGFKILAKPRATGDVVIAFYLAGATPKQAVETLRGRLLAFWEDGAGDDDDIVSLADEGTEQELVLSGNIRAVLVGGTLRQLHERSSTPLTIGECRTELAGRLRSTPQWTAIGRRLSDEEFIEFTRGWSEMASLISAADTRRRAASSTRRKGSTTSPRGRAPADSHPRARCEAGRALADGTILVLGRRDDPSASLWLGVPDTSCTDDPVVRSLVAESALLWLGYGGQGLAAIGDGFAGYDTSTMIGSGAAIHAAVEIDSFPEFLAAANQGIDHLLAVEFAKENRLQSTVDGWRRRFFGEGFIGRAETARVFDSPDPQRALEEIRNLDTTTARTWFEHFAKMASFQVAIAGPWTGVRGREEAICILANAGFGGRPYTFMDDRRTDHGTVPATCPRTR